MKHKDVTPRAEDLGYTSSISAAMLEQAPRGASLLLWSMALFIAVAVAWASWATLDEITRGDGEIIPSRQLQVVQNLEGGIVSEILVREGDLVEQGQVLMRIEDKRFVSSVEENRVRYLELQAKAARLSAEANHEELVLPESFPEQYSSMLNQEVRLYNTRKSELEANLAVLNEQRQQREQELREAEARQGQVRRSYNLLLQELRITEPLLSEGVISEVEYLRLRRQVNDLRGELSGIELSLPRIKSTIEEIDQKRREMELQFRNKARAELNEVAGEQARLQETLTGMQDRIRRTEVRAPIKGRVKQLLINTIGGVVRPGDQLLNIVPWEDKLLVEAKVRPSDIGQLRVGQPAVVKVSAYDYAVYGGLPAQLVYISPSTIVDEQDETYYLVRLETERPYLGDGENMPLMAGMTVSADIMTGKKTVLQYLLKPITRARDRALTER
ncbi:HlyD family type I secretion periplasmic adaptor subunit [Marinobacterium mangrovicola]|uniref:Membrane fusion protein (MFP) family protein n=1 Tax=Marinobacterium mangrovicola TaxID=1476959 RepID=A0A4R1GG14_9GAMM|nr:HlyD family type I secretion periplasmic adaptor subunit [Marinobacterium mangrovicola]TCK07387.1 adhesin transport system membrane fusion protein [Marinobacterium mangrovicola]